MKNMESMNITQLNDWKLIRHLLAKTFPTVPQTSKSTNPFKSYATHPILFYNIFSEIIENAVCVCFFAFKLNF